MARIRLDVQVRQRTHAFRYLDGTELRVRPELRLRVALDLTTLRPRGGPRVAWWQYAEVDTGMSLSMVPERVWRQFDAAAVRRLPAPPGAGNGALALAGGRYGYDLGEIVAAVMGRDETGRVRRVDGVPLVVMLLRDGGAWTDNPVLGLGGGLFERFWLWGYPVRPEYHGRHYPTDADGVHRTDWWLGEVGTDLPPVQPRRHLGQ